MTDPIVIDSLTKDFGGFKAVDNLTLTVPRKSFMGFLGPNGAGKTTTIKILTNLLDASSGEAMLNGIDVTKDPKGALTDVGAVVETPEFYPYLTPVETLSYLGEIRGMRREDIKARTKEVLETVKMTESANVRIGKFSKGMKQRIAVAQALLHEPTIVILDEPTSGLDPRGMVEVRDILKDLRKMDYTIFMSSHLLNEVQEVCTDVAMIDHGKLLAYDAVVNLLHKIDAKKLEVHIANPVSGEAMDKLRGFDGVQYLSVMDEHRFAIDFVGDEEKQAELLLKIQGLGYRVVSFRESGVALENLYMSLIKGSR